MGNHVAVTVGGSNGHFELNVFKPVMVRHWKPHYGQCQHAILVANALDISIVCCYLFLCVSHADDRHYTQHVLPNTHGKRIKTSRALPVDYERQLVCCRRQIFAVHAYLSWLITCCWYICFATGRRAAPPTHSWIQYGPPVRNPLLRSRGSEFMNLGNFPSGIELKL